MNPELRELYQEVILDHNKRPRNRGRVAAPTHAADGRNPLCGDEIDLQLTVQDGTIAAIAFEGHGCAISTASASLMTEAVVGKSVQEALALFERVQAGLTGDADALASVDDDELAALSGVREFPVRIKCAALPWHALRQALTAPGGVASTE